MARGHVITTVGIGVALSRGSIIYNDDCEALRPIELEHEM